MRWTPNFLSADMIWALFLVVHELVFPLHSYAESSWLLSKVRAVVPPPCICCICSGTNLMLSEPLQS